MSQKSSIHQKEQSDQINRIELGGQQIQVKPLNIERGVRLCMLLAPYLPKFRRIYEFMTESEDPDLSVKRIRALVNEMVEFPGDVVKLVSLLIDRDPRWVVKHVSGEGLVALLFKLEEFYDVTQIIIMGVRLSLLDWSRPDG